MNMGSYNVGFDKITDAEIRWNMRGHRGHHDYTYKMGSINGRYSY